MEKQFFYRYGKILAAVIIFLILVVSVMIYNLFASTRLQSDAHTIEIIGEQKELAQRVAKSLISAKDAYIANEDVTASINELVDSSKQFEKYLTVLDNNESLTENVKGEPIVITQITDVESRNLITETTELWVPLKDQINQIQSRFLSETANDDKGVLKSDGIKQELSQSFSTARVAIPLLNEIEDELSASLKETVGDSYKDLFNYQAENARGVLAGLDTITDAYNSGLDIVEQVAQVNALKKNYNDVITTFFNGGSVTLEGDKTFQLKTPGDIDNGLLNEMRFAWAPLNKDVEGLVQAVNSSEKGTLTTPNLFLSTLDYANTNINTISNNMQGITLQLDAEVDKITNKDKVVQAIGLVGAFLCFLFILGQVLFSLRKSDSEVANLQNEADQIFGTVDQGLFLLDKDANISNQHSKELLNIFGVDTMANKSLLGFLKNMVSENDLNQLQRYLGLLFDPHKKERLIQDLNPLQQISAQVDKEGKSYHKFLRFGFSRVIEDGKVQSVLTTVSDITREVELSKKLEVESKRGEQQMDLLRAIMQSDPKLLPTFVSNTREASEEMNDLLRSESSSAAQYKEKADEIGVIIHKVKGESASLSMTMIADLCHEAENEIDSIKGKSSLDGSDFLPLTVFLEKLINYNELIGDLNGRIFSNSGELVAADTITQSQSLKEKGDHFSKFAHDLAKEMGKKVKLRQAGLDSMGLPSKLNSALSTIVSQLIRNSMVHGIESSKQRVALDKEPEGNISMSLYQSDEDFMFVYIDDGNGLDTDEIAKKAIELGIVNDEQIKSMSSQDITNLIFRPNFSLSELVTKNSGRGKGMSAIKDTIAKIGGKVRVLSKPGVYTKFVVRFPKQSLLQDVA